ncbi:MAG: hypothetical protein ACRDRJ_05770 [Streptosporangiaceae bacterium]
MKWQTAWLLIKDIALTGTGLALVLSQVFARQPSDVLLVTGLALTVPSAASHTMALLSGPQSTAGHGQPESSHSSLPDGSPPSSSSSPPSQEAGDER